MTMDMTVGDLVSLLKREIVDRQRLVAELELRTANAAPAPQETRRLGVGAAIVEILRAAGRPMHGLDEILPALQRRGLAPRSRGGFASLVMRNGQIVRTAPGTYALRDASA